MSDEKSFQYVKIMLPLFRAVTDLLPKNAGRIGKRKPENLEIRKKG